MKLHSFRVAAALTAALTTAVSPLLVSAQTTYEYKLTKPGLVVTGAPSDQAGLQLSTTAINFGDVATNTTETRQVLVSNFGTGSLSFTAAPAVTGDASFAAGLTTCGATLAAGVDCLTDATFSPTSVGTYHGVLKFTSVLANSPHEVTLMGTAFNPVSLASTTLPKARLGVPYSYDFKQLLSVSNEASPDKSLATWQGNGTLPVGLSFNTGTGVLSGTPSVLSPGAEYTVTGTYKNNQGQQVYTIKVGDAVLEVVQISAGAQHTCAVTTAGGVKCWGHGGNWALGNNSSANSSVPVQVLGLTSGVTAVAAGSGHTCAIHNGAAKCWGANGSGQLGNSTSATASNPAQVTGLTSGVTSITTGTTHSCAIHNGAAKCWGANSLGQLGNSSNTAATAPVQVTGLTSAVASLAAGYNHTCAVTTGGAARCWGYNYNGQLGNSNNTSANAPVLVTGLSAGVSAISGGERTSCAVHNGAVKCWGYNGSTGMLGNGLTANSSVPVQVSGLTSEGNAVAVGQYHSCAVVSGAAKCWGANTSGQLGNGTNTSSLVPVQVSGLISGVTNILAGTSHTCAIATDGAAKCWGINTSGQLGDGSTNTRTSPVNVRP